MTWLPRRHQWPGRPQGARHRDPCGTSHRRLFGILNLRHSRHSRYSRHSRPRNLRQKVPGYAPPSIRKFIPVIYPACLLQRYAQASPNSSGWPKRPAGTVFMRAACTSSTGLFCILAAAMLLLLSRSVSNMPGRRLLMVTLWATVLRAIPATKPVSPVRAPLDSPRMSIGALTALDVMLTMRPNLHAIMPSTVDLIRSIGVSMFASRAAIHISWVKSRKSPGGGPPALLIRMSGLGQAASASLRPASVVMSVATTVTFTPVALRISSAVASSASRPRASIVTLTPSRASENAQPLPRPLLAAQTRAVLPFKPRSMNVFLLRGF